VSTNIERNENIYRNIETLSERIAYRVCFGGALK
jgi:hypothetical protein